MSDAEDAEDATDARDAGDVFFEVFWLLGILGRFLLVFEILDSLQVWLIGISDAKNIGHLDGIVSGKILKEFWC